MTWPGEIGEPDQLFIYKSENELDWLVLHKYDPESTVRVALPDTYLKFVRSGRHPVLNYQPLPAELFDRRTAALAACEPCGFVWILDEDGCGSIDNGETTCPRCKRFGAGPLYREAEGV